MLAVQLAMPAPAGTGTILVGLPRAALATSRTDHRTVAAVLWRCAKGVAEAALQQRLEARERAGSVILVSAKLVAVCPSSVAPPTQAEDAHLLAASTQAVSGLIWTRRIVPSPASRASSRTRRELGDS